MNFKKIIPDVICVILFALIAFCYFYPADFEGRRLTGHDNTAADGLSVEIKNYRVLHNGETPRWINSIFGGMPTYQVAPSYDSTITMSFLEKVYHLWFPDYVWYIFASMLGFYILLRAFDFRHWMAALGAIVWAFSSYFFIIIAAGHIWKVITLAYVPPTIAGVVLLYRGKYVWGFIVTAFFAALQILSNHVQMTYYFLIPEFCIFFAFLVQAIREKQMARFCKATGLLVAAAAIAVAINASNLYHTYEYAKDTMRGKSELVKAGADRSNQTSSGLDRDYITAWSYGISETWTLLVPNVKGGASVPLRENSTAMKKANGQFTSAGIYGAFTQYWGEQPGTSGPVYVGALVCMLFVLALLIIPNKNPLKWALIIATILSILLSWGKNFMGFTNFFIDHVPMYAKFRTVSSILVVAEFTIPLLALLGLKEFVEKCQQKETRTKMLRALTLSGVITVVCCLFFALAPTAFGDCISTADRNAMNQYVQQGYFDNGMAASILASISTMRAAMVSADAWRSIIIIVIGAVLMYWYFTQSGKIANENKMLKEKGMPTEQDGVSPFHVPASILSIALLVVCLVDMWMVNKRYLNDGMFSRPQLDAALQKTEADEFILSKSGDKRDYRVLNFTVSTFNDNTTSYFYSSVGGYHPAKLRRYQELIEQHIAPEMSNVYKALGEASMDTVAMMSGQSKFPVYDLSAVNTDSLYPVLNMLNTRWFILGAQGGGKIPVENTAAYGNAWFVDNALMVDNANEEMAALHKVSPRHTAVINKNQFAFSKNVEPVEGSIKQTTLTPTYVTYESQSDGDGLAVFSEIYYPGWTAKIDGVPADILRANYVLRAMAIPAGKHVIEMTFDPASVKTTETIANTGLYILLLCIGLALFFGLKNRKKEKQIQ